jgi:hypothetical protein
MVSCMLPNVCRFVAKCWVGRILRMGVILEGPVVFTESGSEVSSSLFNVCLSAVRASKFVNA